MLAWGCVCIAGTFSEVFMWTAEIAPTSPEGLVLCLSSGSARVGSFSGCCLGSGMPFICGHKS